MSNNINTMVIVKNLSNNGVRVGIRERDDIAPPDMSQDEVLYSNEDISDNELHDMCIKISKELGIQMFDNNVDEVV